MLIWEELFHTLFFGNGAWFGIILIIAIVVLVTAKVKISGFLFVIICIFFSIQYFQEIAVNSNYMWCGVVMLLTGFYSLLISMYGVWKRG